mmetsp:Transcript_38841/g.60680  ORF Transcript_38841/g.60680 Transcript_38841/m.60680 type:complete len:220 (+) Transcript_38841:69-728(+)
MIIFSHLLPAPAGPPTLKTSLHRVLLQVGSYVQPTSSELDHFRRSYLDCSRKSEGVPLQKLCYVMLWLIKIIFFNLLIIIVPYQTVYFIGCKHTSEAIVMGKFKFFSFFIKATLRPLRPLLHHKTRPHQSKRKIFTASKIIVMRDKYSNEPLRQGIFSAVVLKFQAKFIYFNVCRNRKCLTTQFFLSYRFLREVFNPPQNFLLPVLLSLQRCVQLLLIS